MSKTNNVNSVKANDGNVWREAKKIFYKDGSSWKELTKGWTKRNNSPLQFWESNTSDFIRPAIINSNSEFGDIFKLIGYRIRAATYQEAYGFEPPLLINYPFGSDINTTIVRQAGYYKLRKTSINQQSFTITLDGNQISTFLSGKSSVTLSRVSTTSSSSLESLTLTLPSDIDYYSNSLTPQGFGYVDETVLYWFSFGSQQDNSSPSELNSIESFLENIANRAQLLKITFN